MNDSGTTDPRGPVTPGTLVKSCQYGHRSMNQFSLVLLLRPPSSLHWDRPDLSGSQSSAHFLALLRCSVRVHFLQSPRCCSWELGICSGPSPSLPTTGQSQL